MCRVRTFGLSPKAQLAVELLMVLAASRQGDIASTLELSRRSRLTRWQVDELSTLLRRAGIISGVRGPRGGFSLCRAAEDVSLACIADAIDTEGGTKSSPARPDARVAHASSEADGSDLLHQALRGFFAALSLRQLEELVR